MNRLGVSIRNYAMLPFAVQDLKILGTDDIQKHLLVIYRQGALHYIGKSV